MAGCWRAAALCLLPALLTTLGAAQEEQQPLPEQLLAQLQTSRDVYTALDLLRALNDTAGSPVGEVLTLQDDIYIHAQDLIAFQGSLPINGGNRIVVLRGGKAGASGGNPTVLDWGSSVNVMYHPSGHSFYAYNLILQGLAPASSGYSAGMSKQMVGGMFWPTYSGEPGHMMAFWNTTIRTVSASCTANATEFRAHAMQHLAGRNDTVTSPSPDTILVAQQLNGSMAVRDTTSGDWVGNVRWSYQNTTLICSLPPTNRSVAPTTLAEVASRAALHTASTGIAGTADELMYLLGSPQVSLIVLGAHISLQAVHWQAYSLPIVLRRNVSLESNDEQLKGEASKRTSPIVLDLGGNHQLLQLSAGAVLSFTRVHLQGTAAPSAVISNRATSIPGSPLWPSVDGDAGHEVRLLDCVMHAIVNPCSRNSTRITVELLRKVLGHDGVQELGDTGYAIRPRYRRRASIINSTDQDEVGSAVYTVENVIMECEEDSTISLAAELKRSAAIMAASSAQAAAAAGSGGKPAWKAAAAAGAAAAGMVASAGGFVLWRRHRRRKRAAGSAAAGPGEAAKGKSPERVPLTPRAANMDRMESGGNTQAAQLDAELDAAIATTAARQCQEPSEIPTGSSGSPGCGSGGRGSASEGRELARWRGPDLEGSWAQDKLWRTRFGVLEGLEIAELLGRGGYGKVYKGRWNGAIVAVKVVEHRVAAGTDGSLSREPLLCMSVSHPNCITTYKLSVIRLLRGDDLLESEDSAGGGRLSDDSECTDDTARTGTGGQSSASGRRVRSLLSGAEAVEVKDPYGQLQPGLYETWIVSEYCDRGTLVEALDEKKLRLPDGSPNMVPVYLCLLDIASGMQYLHSLGIMHSDLKPANVLLKGARNSKRGFICKLADFGLSRMLDGCATHVETGSLGTPTHAAPELLREGHLSPAADVFAFGVLAWELAAGEEAYRGMHPIWVHPNPICEDKRGIADRLSANPSQFLRERLIESPRLRHRPPRDPFTTSGGYCTWRVGQIK